MNKIFLFIFLLLPFRINSSTEPDTKIFVIGTIHYSTNNYNSDTLFNILNIIEPDVILVECDTSYMTEDFQLKEDIQYSFLETRAITKYQRDKKVELRPYDITGRDLFLNDEQRKNNEYNFFRRVEALYRSENLNNDAIEILNRILSMMNISQEMSNSAASYINNYEGSKKIDTINYYSYEGLDRLIKVTPELSDFNNYWEKEQKYWLERNMIMAENILKYKEEFAGKKIVVLCGFAHKNILKLTLEKKALANKFDVVEYWEF
ncbi:MAG: hypothetical protein ABIY50_11485 [Ignavibacteria bacterium]